MDRRWSSEKRVQELGKIKMRERRKNEKIGQKVEKRREKKKMRGLKIET